MSRDAVMKDREETLCPWTFRLCTNIQRHRSMLSLLEMNSNIFQGNWQNTPFLCISIERRNSGGIIQRDENKIKYRQGLTLASPALQTVSDLCFPKKYLAKPHSQISTKYWQKRIIIFCLELWHSIREVQFTRCSYQCSTTGKPTRSFATERVSLDSV